MDRDVSEEMVYLMMGEVPDPEISLSNNSQHDGQWLKIINENFR